MTRSNLEAYRRLIQFKENLQLLVMPVMHKYVTKQTFIAFECDDARIADIERDNESLNQAIYRYYNLLTKDN